ncbi:LysR family transcriptional regulator [Ferribacterium limneticum]|uniref:LysR family transcriptional regulator n=1 Tax=Ferribacterium limneticum TaxID=76259 RepID=UPI001CFA7005|nr:LysR family transcriptional regulator [Ferribacterium limneticum]UCV29565.1 LysR family transcriptional regulator [Ferribacterium limneticum]UCV33484.1 LysR family transcriptional regulator [Ferribacterium limneticum]
MDRLKQIEAFVLAATRGSLSAAARVEGVTPAIIGRRLDALETRLGVKLLLRTTRKLTITFEGQAFLEDCQKTLNDLANAEAAVSLGSVRASGQLRVSAPSGFGRQHVAPLVGDFMLANPEVRVNLNLSDRLVDLVNENIDCAIRIGELTDSSLVSVRLGEMRRMVVASPAYLVAHGVPREPVDLSGHNCLSLGQQRGWLFRDPASGEVHTLKVNGTFECNDGAVLREWALAGRGLAWRSLWEVGQDLKEGRLTSVLDAWQAPPMGIYAVFPQRRHLPLRVRLFIDLLKETYSRPSYWELR